MKSSALTVRARLTLAFGALAAAVLLVAGLAWQALEHESDAFEHFVTGINARAAVANAVRLAVDERAMAARNLVLVATPQERQAEHAKVQKAQARIAEKLGQLQQMARADGVSARARALVAEIARVEQAYAAVAAAIVELAMGEQHEEAVRRMNDECRPLLAQLIQATEAYAGYTAERATQGVAESNERVAAERNRFLLVATLAFLAAAVSGALIVRSLTRALGAEPAALSAAASNVAAGDLRPVAGLQDAPAGSVLASLAIMRDSLSDIVSQVRDASESMATGAVQIAVGSADLSQRTEEQASALEETASTMDELGATVRNNAENAQQANVLAQTASDVATRGGDAMGDVVQTMRGIDTSAKKIVDIIGTIDGIAFQTNILALNAAVEAARAGEQGRGFAVVAGEVRTLAQRSAQAAKEIKTLISSSVEQVEKGSLLVDRAGHTMQEVVGAIRRVTGIVAEISAASREQSAGVEQVRLAVSQIDQVTQQNAALVEESAAAAESLRQQSSHLVQAVAVFSLG